MPTVEELAHVFEKGWRHPESASGPGSSRQATYDVKKGMQNILAFFTAKEKRPVILNDAGCGDLAWVSEALPDGTDYQGYDVVEWPTWPAARADGWKLEVLDICTQQMRLADVVLCRGVMIHLPNQMCLQLLGRCQESAKWLLATSYRSGVYGMYDRTFDNEHRIKVPTRGWSRLDLTLPPFSLGEPKAVITEAHGGKYLGLWDLRP